MLKAIYSGKFKKEVKIAQKRGKNIEKLKNIISDIINEIPLAPKNRNHKLKGEFQNYWECHIEPNWLLIYKKTNIDVIFLRTGTHNDLFE